jgi:hypothetical protein
MGAAIEDLQKIGIKLFAADAVAVRPHELIPVFHRWIQTSAVRDHMLIDVADYEHVPEGPGVLLVAHEGNFSLDLGDGKMGWLYLRKQPLAGPLPARLRAIARTALETAQLLEQDAALGGQLRFRADALELVANDRLRAPNTPATQEALQPAVRELLQALYGEAACAVTPQGDRRERWGVKVAAAKAESLDGLLQRL